MASVAKYNKSQVGGLLRHFERAKNKDNEYIRFSNQEINISKTHLNYNLSENKNQLSFVKNRCGEVKCLNRENVNVMCSWVITLPKDLKDVDEEKKFFEECYKFLNDRYGEPNVISAYVHKDETSPHIHYAFVPVVRDKKSGIEKVSAKELLNKRDLQTFHNDLDKYMENVFGRNVGILNQATKDGNRSIKELKRKSAVERLSEIEEIIQEKISNADNKVLYASKKLSEVNTNINVLVENKNALEKQISTYNKTLSTYADIESIGSKKLFGKVKMSSDDADKLKEQAKAYFAVNSKNYDLELQNKKLLSDNKNMQKELSSIKHEYKKIDKKLSHVIYTLKSNPELSSAFNKQLEINKQSEQQESKMNQERIQERKDKLKSIKKNNYSR